MNRTRILTAAATVSFGVLTLAPTLASAESKCANPRGFVEERACAALAAGPDELRRYIERTRMIHGLYYWDFAVPDL